MAHDNSRVMQTVGKLPGFDSMSEFHDGWTRDVSWLGKGAMLQISIVPALSINYAATYHEYLKLI